MRCLGFRVQGLGLAIYGGGGSQNEGYFIESPYTKDYNILGLYWVPYFGKPPHGKANAE